ncbi:MAG: hypothetical protein RL022_2551, partial [Chloroflexota bacterium]
MVVTTVSMAPDVPDEIVGGVLDTFEPGEYDPGL